MLEFKSRLEGWGELDNSRILPRGLTFNTSKCEVLCLNEGGQLNEGFNNDGWRILTDGGMMVAGLPVGSIQFGEGATILKTKTICARISKMIDPSYPHP